MQKKTWNEVCCVCRRPIKRGKPTILFNTDMPMMAGICHSICSYRRFSYGHFQTCPPNHLSDEQVSFLVHFYYRFYNLPGGQEPNRELRLCAIGLLQNYPDSLRNPMATFRQFLDEYKHWHREWLYEGDLETDFLQLLGDVQREAREEPTQVEIDFRVK